MQALKYSGSLFSALVLSAGMSHGALIIYESFDDLNASVVNNTPGLGLTGTYASTGSSSPGFSVSGSSLSYGSQPTSGGSAFYVAPLSTQTGNMTNAVDTLTGAATPGSLENAGLLTDGATLWFSVLQRSSHNASDDRFAFALGSDHLNSNTNFNGTGTQAVGFAIGGAGNLTARVTTAGSTHTYGVNIDRFSLAETIMIVGKITWGATDTVELYLPDTSMNLGSAVSTATAAVDQSTFDRLSFFTRWQSSTTDGLNTDVAIDEIRFGSTLGDVMIPEPSTFLLAGLGLLTALLHRRRA